MARVTSSGVLNSVPQGGQPGQAPPGGGVDFGALAAGIGLTPERRASISRNVRGQGRFQLGPRAPIATAGLLGLGSLLAAAGQLNDPTDSGAGNMADATGAGIGSGLGGFLGGAGGALLTGGNPVGALVGGSIGASLGGDAGKNLVRGVYNALTATNPQDQALNAQIRAAKAQAELRRSETLADLPMLRQIAEQQLAIDKQRAEIQAQLAWNQNFQNAALTNQMNQNAAGNAILMNAFNQAVG